MFDIGFIASVSIRAKVQPSFVSRIYLITPCLYKGIIELHIYVFNCAFVFNFVSELSFHQEDNSFRMQVLRKELKVIYYNLIIPVLCL